MKARVEGMSKASTVRTLASGSRKSRLETFSIPSGEVRSEMPIAIVSAVRLSTSPPSMLAWSLRSQ